MRLGDSSGDQLIIYVVTDPRGGDVTCQNRVRVGSTHRECASGGDGRISHESFKKLVGKRSVLNICEWRGALADGEGVGAPGNRHRGTLSCPGPPRLPGAALWGWRRGQVGHRGTGTARGDLAAAPPRLRQCWVSSRAAASPRLPRICLEEQGRKTQNWFLLSAPSQSSGPVGTQNPFGVSCSETPKLLTLQLRFGGKRVFLVLVVKQDVSGILEQKGFVKCLRAPLGTDSPARQAGGNIWDIWSW